MGMNMAGEHCPNCGHDLEEGQIGLCELCTAPDPDFATHGSPELDADARKLEAQGQDAGPTFGELGEQLGLLAKTSESLLNCLVMTIAVLDRNQRAWEGEEDSVKEEHADLIAGNAKVLQAAATWLAKVK